jgi:hypothetical protein
MLGVEPGELGSAKYRRRADDQVTTPTNDAIVLFSGSLALLSNA